MEICLVVVDHETMRNLKCESFGAIHKRLGQFGIIHGDTEHLLNVIPVSELHFWPSQLADCYVFQSDEHFSPWILNLGRYLPGHHDWTTTTEILKKAPLGPESSLEAACKLIVQGKVIPFEPFTTTWLFMRRHYSVLFSQENCEAVGCNYQQYRQLLAALRRGLEKQIEYRKSVYRPEPLITVSDFLEGWRYGLSGIGAKYLSIINKIVEKHGLYLKTK